MVIYADDHGFYNDVQQLSSSIDTMLFFEEKSPGDHHSSLLLTQYQIGGMAIDEGHAGEAVCGW